MKKYDWNKIIFAMIATVIGHFHNVSLANSMGSMLSRPQQNLEYYLRDFDPIQQGTAHNIYIPSYTPMNHALNTIELPI